MADDPKKRPPLDVKPAEGTAGKMLIKGDAEERERFKSKIQK